MVQEFTLDELLLEKNKNTYRRELNKTTVNFYGIVNKVDPNPYSEEKTAVVNAMEKFFATYLTFKQTLRDKGNFKPDTNVKADFLEALALYAGAAEALHQLSKIKIDPSAVFSSGNSGQVRFNDNCDAMFKNLTTAYTTAVDKRISNGKDLVKISKDYFRWILDSAKAESKQEKYAPLVSQVNQIHIKINDITINGFNSRDKQELRAQNFNHTLDDIVGNTEAIKKLKRSTDKTIMYVPEEQINVYGTEFGEFPQTFLIWGDPGCGKTATIEAIANYGMRNAEKHGKKFIVKNITNEFKSKYYGESSNNLRDILLEAAKGDAVYFFVIDDIDLILPSRKDRQIDPADKANLEAIMSVLEGVASVNKGNYMIVSTSNCPLDLDPALMRRLAQEQVHAKGPETAEDYAQLLQKKLKREISKGYVETNDWNRIGALCKDYKLSGSDVRDIARTVTAEIYDVDIPDELKSKRSKEQITGLNALYHNRKVGGDTLTKLVEEKYRAKITMHNMGEQKAYENSARATAHE